jgi:hypothetical protein
MTIDQDSLVGHKDRSLVLRGIGALALLGGLAAAYIGPIEISCFYLFSEGGRFQYQGFGFGSFMFGNIAAQVLGYYLVAIALIPLGYGHLKLRRWARPLALTFLWLWLILGIPLIPLLLFMLFSAKDMGPVGAVIVVILVGLSYLLVPILLIRFYNGQNVRSTFEDRDPARTWLDRVSLPVLVLGALFLFYLLVLHMLLLFNGIFPAFGAWLSGMPGITAIDLAILCLGLLTWGVLRSRAWAWWGSLLYVGLLTISSLLTLARSTWTDIVSAMALPPQEVEMLSGVPLQGAHFAVVIGIPLVATLGLIAGSWRYYTPARSTAAANTRHRAP